MNPQQNLQNERTRIRDELGQCAMILAEKSWLVSNYDREFLVSVSQSYLERGTITDKQAVALSHVLHRYRNVLRDRGFAPPGPEAVEVAFHAVGTLF